MVSYQKKEILFGINPIKIALKVNKRKCYKLSYISDIAHTDLISKAKKNNIATQQVSKEAFDKHFRGQNHQGVMLECEPLQYEKLKYHQLLEKDNAQILILDQLQDPQNVGAIIRTAEFIGYDAVIVFNTRSCPLTPVVSKASAGAMEQALIFQETNLQQSVQQLKKDNFWIIGSDMKGESLYQFDVPQKHALILGNEHEGLRHLTKQNCDFLLSIPGGKIDSLNVNAAAAIFMNFMKYKLSL